MTDRAAAAARAVVVGIDVGGTKTNATVVDESGTFLVDRMVETPSCVTEGPEAAVAAIGAVMLLALDIAGARREMVRGFRADAESVASLAGITRNLLPCT